MCCSPNRKAMRAATYYHTRAWQTLIYGKECYIVIVIYLPFKHKQSQIILFNCMQKKSTVNHEAYNELTEDRRQSKTSIISTNVDQNSKKIEFLIAISHPTGNTWQSKTLVLVISDPRSSIVRKEFSIAAYPVWKQFFFNTNMKNVNYSLLALASDCFGYVFSRPIFNKHFT